MPKTVVLDTFNGRISVWVTVDPDDMQVTVDYTISGGGVSQSKSKDVTSGLTAGERLVILNFARKLIAAAKQQEGI